MTKVGFYEVQLWDSYGFFVLARMMRDSHNFRFSFFFQRSLEKKKKKKRTSKWKII